MLKMVFGIPFRVAFKANLCDAFIFITFWIHLAFDPFQYYPVSSATFIRIGSGYHLKFLDIQPTVRGPRFVTFEKSQKVYLGSEGNSRRNSENASLEEVHGHQTQL